MIERFVVPKTLGEDHLAYKIRAIKAEGLRVERVEEGQIPQAGSRSTPYAANYGMTEPGWIIHAENGRQPYKSIITGEMVTEM